MTKANVLQGLLRGVPLTSRIRYRAISAGSGSIQALRVASACRAAAFTRLEKSAGVPAGPEETVF